MNISYAKEYGDKKFIRILNSINEPSRAEFFCILSNKTSEIKLSEHRKNRLLKLAEVRLMELN